MEVLRMKIKKKQYIITLADEIFREADNMGDAIKHAKDVVLHTAEEDEPVFISEVRYVVTNKTVVEDYDAKQE
jgi:hypothetical protein